MFFFQSSYFITYDILQNCNKDMKNNYLKSSIKGKSVSLPKLHSQVFPKKQQSHKSKEKRNIEIMRNIKPVTYVHESEDDSDTEMVMRKLQTPTKKSSLAEVVVIGLNQRVKQRPKKRFVKQLFVGEEAVQKFYDRYKNMQKYRQKNDFMKTQDPISKIVQLMGLHGFAPRKLDVIKLKGSHAILNLRKLGLGQGKMGPVITDIMNYIQNFECVDLSHNMIDRTVSESIVEQLSRVKIINLSHNRIGKVACDKFTQLFFGANTRIEELYLQDNSLLDNGGVSLLTNLVDYGNLRVLNLSKNFLSHKFAVALKQFLSQDEYLDQLYLSWNQITDKSAKLIFQGLDKNTNLKVFDFSWNQIGFFSVDSLTRVLKTNESLIHLDLSFCQIDRKNSLKISKALESNHTIYGMHYEGNSGLIDLKGYLQVTEKEFSEYPLPIVRGLLRQIDSIRPNKIHNEYREHHERDICWICESWQEVYFKIKKIPEAAQCFLHFQHEHFKPLKMENNEGFYEGYRMCPLGEIRFFFGVAKAPGEFQPFTSSSFKTSEFNEEISVQIGKATVHLQLTNINTHFVQYTQDVIDEYYYASVRCQPRSLEVTVSFKQKQQSQFKQAKKKKMQKMKKKRKVMKEQKLQIQFRQINEGDASDFLNNVDNRDDNEVFLRQCLEFDISNSKICRLIKAPHDLLSFKQMMLKYYRAFKDTFYWLASGNPSANGIFSIPEWEFEKFIEEQKYISKRVTHPKIMLKMYSCLSGGDQETPSTLEPIKSAQVSPQKKTNEINKLFSRPQFLQFLIRLALEKWCVTLPKPKKKKQQDEKKEQEEDDEPVKKEKLNLPLPLIAGIQRTMKSLVRYADRLENADWRKYKYLVYDNYVVIKGYEIFLISLFQKYANNKKKLDKPKRLKGLLTLEQLKSILVETDIKRTKQAAKDIDQPFLFSIKLPIQDGKIPFGLNYDEFVECLARYSEVIWFAPIASEKNRLWDWELNRKNVPLFIRFQALIANIYRRNLEFQSRKMNKIVEKGLFAQQTQILLEKIKSMDIGAQTDLAWKMNRMAEETISLQGLVENLKDKYENVTIQKEEQIEQEYIKEVQYD